MQRTTAASGYVVAVVCVRISVLFFYCEGGVSKLKYELFTYLKRELNTIQCMRFYTEKAFLDSFKEVKSNS